MSQFYVGGSGGGGGSLNELDANIGNATPAAGIIDVVGYGTVADGVSTAPNIITSGAGNTLTISNTKAQFVTEYVQIGIADSPYTATSEDYYISVDSSGGSVTVRIPNAPTGFRMFLIKDATGDATTNPVTITTPGGAVLIDGSTTYTLDEDYEAVLLTFNNVSYEAF